MQYFYDFHCAMYTYLFENIMPTKTSSLARYVKNICDFKFSNQPCLMQRKRYVITSKPRMMGMGGHD